MSESLDNVRERLRAKASRGSSKGRASREPHTSIEKVLSNRERQNSRRKGSKGELDVAKMFSAWSGEVVRRTPMSGGWSNARFGVTGDLVCSKRAWPFHVEVKHHDHDKWSLDDLVTGARADHKTSIRQWWIQCIESCPKNYGRLTKLPLLVFRRNRQPWFVMLQCVSAGENAHPILWNIGVSFLQYHWHDLPFEAVENVVDVIIMRLDVFLDTIEVPKGLKNRKRS